MVEITKGEITFDDEKDITNLNPSKIVEKWVYLKF